MQRKVTERESVFPHDREHVNKSFFGCGLEIRTNPAAQDKVHN